MRRGPGLFLDANVAPCATKVTASRESPTAASTNVPVPATNATIKDADPHPCNERGSMRDESYSRPHPARKSYVCRGWRDKRNYSLILVELLGIPSLQGARLQR